MKPDHPPSALARWLDFLNRVNWTPDQALAVVELLDKLPDCIWAHYASPLFDLLREERGSPGKPLPAGHSSADDRADEPTS